MRAPQQLQPAQIVLKFFALCKKHKQARSKAQTQKHAHAALGRTLEI
jgi:hypothetical protein